MEPATQNQTENREMETTRGHKTDTVPTNSAAGRFPAGLRLRGQFPAEHMERTNHSVLFPAGENTQGSNNHMPRAMHSTKRFFRLTRFFSYGSVGRGQRGTRDAARPSAALQQAIGITSTIVY